MGVAQDHSGVGVTQKLADRVKGYARLYQAAGKVMPQIVKAKVLQLCSVSKPAPSPIYPLQWVASHTRKDL
jgi:hypothetical protein